MPPTFMDDLLRDATLDPDIQYPLPLSPQWQAPTGIFLTGATGFLGSYLLAELLQKTSADLYCLVRAKDKTEALARLHDQLAFYQLWREEYNARIVTVAGDLSQPSFGLSNTEFTQLAADVDVIYHNGAQVNATYPYARLKASNVDGTKTVLRLASMAQTKPVHFISTLAVFFTDNNRNKLILEHDIPILGDSLKGGYKQSKWVAEALIREAQQRGLPATIYRPGRIWGDSQHAIMDRFSDLLCTLVQGGIHLGAYPVVDSTLNIASVDYVSQAIVSLSQQSVAKQAFHLSNPQSTEWNTLWDLIQALGYPLEKNTMPEWSSRIIQHSKGTQERRLYLVLRNLMRSPIYLFSEKPDFDTSQTQQKLASSNIYCPIMDETLLAVYLHAFQKSGYIPLASHP